LSACTLSFEEFHANFRLDFSGDLVRKWAAVTTEAASSARKITAHIPRISMEVLAACASRTISIEPCPITTQISFDNWSFHFIDRLGDGPLIRVKLPTSRFPTEKLVAWQSSLINTTFTFEDVV